MARWQPRQCDYRRGAGQHHRTAMGNKGTQTQGIGDGGEMNDGREVAIVAGTPVRSEDVPGFGERVRLITVAGGSFGWPG